MVDPKAIDEIRRLLSEGCHSYRDIARATGTSPSTVWRVASGKRNDQRAKIVEFPDLGPLGRCPVCGGRVLLPCRLCRVRALARRRRLPPCRIA